MQTSAWRIDWLKLVWRYGSSHLVGLEFKTNIQNWYRNGRPNANCHTIAYFEFEGKFQFLHISKGFDHKNLIQYVIKPATATQNRMNFEKNEKKEQREMDLIIWSFKKKFLSLNWNKEFLLLSYFLAPNQFFSLEIHFLSQGKKFGRDSDSKKEVLLDFSL